MKRIALLILPLFVRDPSFAQYKPLDKQSQVQFKIKNFGFSVSGSFTGLSGDISFDPAHPETASFDVSVDAATVNTENSWRDSHLRNEDYFDVTKFPRIRLVSDKITTSGRGFTFTGKLTIKNVIRPVSFPFTADPSPGGGYVFKGDLPINRRDFNVGGASTISDKLEVNLNVVAK
ncbi:MAG: YceI family protein [Bacteroidota bacterium]|nr:YceI family protein [Bacteroidota bacterium]MDP4246062.1 YceI family protein [Bacteroidota bacterium]MDP4255265.1 YceI family protein [Bacteroidota bacterium]MDP4258811.1 YceI family protein [Bacteroidota bacterium]